MGTRNNHSNMNRRIFQIAALIAAGLVLALATSGRAAAHPEEPAHHNPLPEHATDVMRAFWADREAAPLVPGPLAVTRAKCRSGFAAGYPCDNIDLKAFMPLADIGGTIAGSAANDIWGWTDPQTGSEYAIIGRVFGTSFVDISNPSNPVYLGQLATHGAFGSSWRDIKTYANHAFIVSEASGHGMQVFDLTQLRNVASPPVSFSETAHYPGFSYAHNLVINEDTGFAYAVGTDTCSAGLHMVNIQNPTDPTYAGCFSGDGPTHDAQCVTYSGPDALYQGREICFNSNGDTLTIVDVTDKPDPVQLSRTPYAGVRFTHQGWLTGDHTYFLLGDEMDEIIDGVNTSTLVWNVSDLDSPTMIGSFVNSTAAIDHNQYVKGNLAYQANYRSGLRVLDISGVASASLSEVAYFDVYPANDAANFNGAWSNYPYFDSGVVVVSGIEQGLFILIPNPCKGLAATIVGTNGPDFLVGTPGDDVIVGLDGDDVILGMGGRDIICAGSGDDFVSGGAGNDWISGDSGSDILLGGDGKDRIFGRGGNDTLIGGKGRDSLFGNRGNDTMDGGPGHDRLFGANGDDILAGRGGDDSIDCGSGTDTADGGPGTDTATTDCTVQANIP